MSTPIIGPAIEELPLGVKAIDRHLPGGGLSAKAMTWVGVLLETMACPIRMKPEIDERMGMAANSVPEPYHDAFARLQCQKLMAVSDVAGLLREGVIR